MIKPPDRGGDILCRALALHQHRPDQHMHRVTFLEPMQDITDHRPCRAGDNTDDARHGGDHLLAFRREQALGHQPPTAFLQLLEQGPLASQFNLLHHDLVFRSPGIGGQLACHHHFQSFFGLGGQLSGNAFPADGIEGCAVILEREIHMP